jgi:protein required for attachment to host cells
MHRTCIAVVDASRARLLTLDRIVDATGIRDELVEHEDLVNPARRTTPGSLFADRAGKAYSGPIGFGVDDHRRDHVESLDAAFARAIVRRLATHTADRRVTTVVLCASPHMLGELRRDVAALQRPHLAIRELARDLVELAPHALQAQLAAHHLL